MAVIWNKNDLLTLAEKKIAEINNICENTIYNGINVQLSNGTEHFSFTVNDQSNLDSMFSAITLGATEYPYHSDGNPCKMYSAADIMTLYIKYKEFLTYHTTYCNQLHTWINREESNEVISSIYYGIELPDDLKTNMDKLLDNANKQIQNIVLKLQANLSYMS